MLNPEFLKNGPGPRLAFLEKPDPRLIAEAMVAFANTEGGTLVVGLKEDAEINGKVEAETLGRALKEADALTSPSIVTGNWEPVETEQGTVYALRIPRSIELHALTDGRVLIRTGKVNRPLGGQEILKLASAKSTGDYESEPVPGVTKDDFSRKMIDEYLAKRAERSKRPYNGKIDDLLREIGAIDNASRATVSGVLLFTEFPQQWLPQA
ncbi:MAG: putative DNA binding domain-containing protein, partial [Anaerolinea sp.]|nr:putative DNA binding domain-containing protein [Anaerolinea sp.]